MGCSEKKDVTPPPATPSMSKAFTSKLKNVHPPKVLKNPGADNNVLPAASLNTAPSVYSAEAPNVSLTHSDFPSKSTDVPYTGSASLIVVLADMECKFLSQTQASWTKYLHSVIRIVCSLLKFPNAPAVIT